jgi:hypothetical protein
MGAPFLVRLLAVQSIYRRGVCGRGRDAGIDGMPSMMLLDENRCSLFYGEGCSDIFTRDILGALDILVDIGVFAEKEVIQ